MPYIDLEYGNGTTQFNEHEVVKYKLFVRKKTSNQPN